MQFSPLIEELIQALRCLPGVGPKSAQRMALQLLERDRSGGVRLASVLQESMARVGHCTSCRTLTEEELCRICRSGRRNTKVLCVVETPADMLALEQSGVYDGRYFVLLGHLSPLAGIGPDDLGFEQLVEKLGNEPVEEINIKLPVSDKGDTDG